MGKSKFLKPDQTFSQDLSSGVLSFTTNFKGFSVELNSINVDFSTAVTERITFYLDSIKGSDFDTILPRGRFFLVGQKDLYYVPPDGKLFINAGDEIRIECTNDNTNGIAYGIVKSSEPS